MTDLLLNSFTERFRNGRNAPEEVAGSLLDAMITSGDEALLGSLLSAWNSKGIAAEEIYSIAAVMRSRCQRLSSPYEIFVDIVGTGGSRAKTFNVSTAAAFVVAGAGVPVAKHGNKAASSRSGSADVLTSLGIKADIEPAVAEECLKQVGICFMFAPKYHRLSPALAAARRKIGAPTIFNCVGPLCNPANVPVQVIGVWDKGLIDPVAAALAKLGTTRSWVVHAESGLDEIAAAGCTFVAEVAGGKISRYEVGPTDFGLREFPVVERGPATPEESADVILGILAGQTQFPAVRSLVVMNAAAAIYLAGRAETLTEASELALRSIESGNALDKLKRLAAATNQ